MNKESRKVEVLGFIAGTRQATVVTDGEHHKTFEETGARNHQSLMSAIAHLECRGYHIITDSWL